MTNTRYIPAKEVAALIRKDLKAAFPSITFSVVTRHGRTVNVDWIDGPTTKQVDDLIGWYAGADFDGMIDLKSYHNSILNGEKVSFGSDYIFTRRSYSHKVCEQVANTINSKYDFKVEVKVNSYGSSIELVTWNSNNQYWINEELRNYTAQPEAAAKPAAKQQKYPEALFL